MENLKDELETDIKNARGALREILDHNRAINQTLVDSMLTGDMSQIEEYNMLTKNILDSVKLLSDINNARPKTIKEIDSIQPKKGKIDLSDLVD